MINKNEWNEDEVLKLYNYKFQENLSYKDISDKMGKSTSSIRNKVKRVNWDEFIKNPKSYLEEGKANKKWTQAEMGLMYAYLEEKKPYDFISEKIGRGRIAVERKAQTTDWQAWKVAVGSDPEFNEETADEDSLVCQLTEALIVLSRREFKRLKSINEKEFRRKVNFENTPLPISFTKLKEKVEEHLESLGLKNPEEISLGEGTYIVVGDSHGKFTKTNVFNLLSQFSDFVKPKNIIHLGHILDDDNDISYEWGRFKNLIVVSKLEELHLMQEQRNKFNFHFDIVRGCINIGNDLTVMNQDMITDYTKTPISSLDASIFDQKVIVNCHRFEFFPKCSELDDVSYIASPGALCEKHIVRTIKQIDFGEGRTIKQANWEGFSKYRRMKHMYRYWNQGIMVVHVDADGNHTIIPCLIKEIKGGFATSYFDKIITNKGVRKPTKKIFVTGDAHSPSHRHEVLDIHQQIVNDYKPDDYVNLGDASDYRMLNHHIMDRGGVINGDIVYDAASTHKVLKKQSRWAKNCHIQLGNHERFADDFIEKYPQLKNLLNFEFLCSVKDLGYKITGLKMPIKIGSTKFIHGDMRLYGQTGQQLEKVSKTFGESVFMGHVHYPAIRQGTFVVGLTGELDQRYNEPSASTWIHGFGMCNHYAGKSWPTTIAIVNDECRINNKVYTPKDAESWELKDYAVKLDFSVD